MSMKPLTWVAILSSACHQPDPATDSDSGGGLFDYSEKAYYSELVVTIDGAAESLGDGELFWRSVEPAPGEACVSATQVFFHPVYGEVGPAGDFYFLGDDGDLAPGSTATIPEAPYTTGATGRTAMLPSWAGIVADTYLSGGEITYTQPGTTQHQLTAAGTSLCVAPDGGPLFIEPATDCRETTVITFEFTGNMKRDGAREGASIFAKDPTAGDMCVIL